MKKSGPTRDSAHQLLVEGLDDKYAVINLMIKRGYSFESSQSVYVKECNGISGLLNVLPEVYKQSGLKALGIIVDSDEDPQGRWQSVRGRLQDIGMSVPESLNESGTIFSAKCRVGIWLMPDNKTRGILEDFLAYLVPANDPIWAHAKTATQKALDLQAHCPEKDRTKAEIHSWLAWQREPGKPLGTAISAGFLSGSSKEVAEFEEWFLALFDPNSSSLHQPGHTPDPGLTPDE